MPRTRDRRPDGGIERIEAHDRWPRPRRHAEKLKPGGPRFLAAAAIILLQQVVAQQLLRAAERQQGRAADRKHRLAEQQPVTLGKSRLVRARRMARSRPSRTMSGSSSMARTCHCTEGCSAAKAASRGASHSEATEPLAEIASIGRVPRARSRTASQAVASCAKVASTARSSSFALRGHRRAGVAGAVARPRQQIARPG